MRLLSLAALLLSFHISAFAQQDTARKMEEVTITGLHSSAVRLTSLNIEPYTLEELDTRMPFNLSDAMSHITGVSQLNTGNAISKPVVRGLYGNRVLVLLSGLRFDNQQFQDEHGLGLSQIGIDRIELIKGPASILYGTDAMGAVINVIEELPQEQGKILDINTRFFANTLGSLTDIGYANRKGEKWWRLRLGAESHADYSDGNNNRVLNSRNTGYYLKAGMGNSTAKHISNNTYNFSFNQFGFITPDLHAFFDPDARWSRAMTGPHHNVVLNALSSQHTFLLPSSVLKVNAGLQSNLRMEDEGGGEISLFMHLISLLENAKWEKQLGANTLFMLNQQFTFENNTNFGKRILIPDANMMEGNLSGFLRYAPGKLLLEAGLGANYKHIQTFLTMPLNGPSKNVHPFSIGRPTANAMLGLSYNPLEALNIKTNISSGSRAANLAELSSDGLHEGYYRYEVGDPNMKLEQNVNWDISAELNTKHLFISASAYYNRFWNYIYLAPDSLNFFGFPIYDFRQQDATIYGAEFNAQYRFLNALTIKESFSYIRGTLSKGGYLPFIPADRNKVSLEYSRDINKTYTQLYVEPEFEYALPQDRAAQFETTTSDYGLLNVYAGFTAGWGRHAYKWSLGARNVLNKAYHDHLSRLADPGLFVPAINNQGISVVISLNVKLKV